LAGRRRRRKKKKRVGLIELGGPKEEEEEKKNGGLIGGPGESARWCFSLPGKLHDEAGTSPGAPPPRRPFRTSSAALKTRPASG
jgi:hypothetical protein